MVNHEEYVRWLEIEGDRFAAAVEAGPRQAAVAGCPGWTVYDLADHLGFVHRWAATAARTGERPDVDHQKPADDDGLADWYRDRLNELCDTLRNVSPDAPTWHPFPAEQVAGLWARRQALETVVHRWDAQHAVLMDPAPIDPALASDGVDEFFSVLVPRIITRNEVTTPTPTVHLHCTDVDGEWLAWTDDDGYQFRREHAKGDAAVRGPAADLLLFMFNRTEQTGEMAVFGDESVVTEWRSIPGF